MEAGSSQNAGGRDEDMWRNDNRELIRHMIESMVDAEHELDVLLYDTPGRGGTEEDKPENQEGAVVDWQHEGEGPVFTTAFIPGNPDAVLRNLGREAVIQPGIRVVRALYRNVLASDEDLTQPYYTTTFPIHHSAQGTSSGSLQRRDRADSAASQSKVGLRKTLLKELESGNLTFPSVQTQFDPPLPPERLLLSIPRGFLHTGARFRGAQRTKSRRSQAEVYIQYVDFVNLTLIGIVRVKNTSLHLPDTETMFHGEIISEKHPFLSRKWNGTIINENVLGQWNRFSCFQKVGGNDVAKGTFDYSKLLDANIMFMRWKEKCSAEDRIDEIDELEDGATGYYYMVLSETKGEMSGFYNLVQDEMYQHLLLRYVEPGVFDDCEIR